jgi:predicted Zn-dependent protease
MEQNSPTRDSCQKVVALAEDVENDSAIHAALILYKAKALRELGLYEAAQNVLTEVLRRRKDRPEDLLLALRYERALVYEGLGQNKKARSELEKLYAEAPDYEDVKQRLGL